MAKVCPKCHASHPEGVEFCPNDGSRLQAMPPKPSPSAQEGERHFSATLVGVGGDQVNKLAAALHAQHDEEAEATLAFDVSALRQAAPAQKPADGIRPAPPPPPQKTIPPMQRPPGLAPKPMPAPARPQSAAVHAPPAAVTTPVATTLAKLIETSGALPTNLAVGRVCDLAELLARGRPSTPVTPAHVGYSDTTGSGKPRWTDAAGLDPVYLAQYRPPDLDQGATQATDTYILACVLFEALTGKAPFRGKTVDEVVRKQTMAAAPAVRQIKTDCELPPSLEIELQRALKKRPGDRHPTVAAFVEGIRNAVREDDRSTTALDVSEVAYLQELLQGGQALAQQSNAPSRTASAPVKAVVPAAPARVAPAAPAPAPVAPPAPAAPTRTGLMVGGAIAVVAVLGGGAFLATRGTPPAPPPAVQAPEPPREQPDVVQAPDVQPDIQPDIPPDVPDVQPDVAQDIQVDVEKAKAKPLPHKVDAKVPEVKVEPKIEPKQDKKPDVSRPPVF